MERRSQDYKNDMEALKSALESEKNELEKTLKDALQQLGDQKEEMERNFISQVEKLEQEKVNMQNEFQNITAQNICFKNMGLNHSLTQSTKVKSP